MVALVKPVPPLADGPLRIYPRDILFEAGTPSAAKATVCITLFNYDSHIVDCLESVYDQTLEPLSLVVLDDRSRDRGLARASRWAKIHANRFASVCVARHRRNRGLAAARNAAFDLSPSEFVMTLDADNQLYPRCVERLLGSLRDSRAAFAYSIIEQFDNRQGLMGCNSWSPELLKSGNYIDAMALIRKSVWRQLNGYRRMRVGGWEDYDFWCKVVEAGFVGQFVPEILARYRMHAESMLRTETDRGGNDRRVRRDMQARHPWLEL
jgi:glycosyltransferase involved in cell wall biosynthesis